MSIDALIPTPQLSKTEEDLLTQIFLNDTVQKYLRLMALEETKELLAFASISHPDETISKAVVKVQGKLEVLSTLLSISQVQPPKES